MTIINMAAQPYTSEYFQASTASLYVLTTGLYAPSSGICRSYADRALISLETANIYYKMNGSAPATGCGHLFIPGDYLVLDDPAQMINFKFMNAEGTATAYVHVTYFGG